MKVLPTNRAATPIVAGVSQLCAQASPKVYRPNFSQGGLLGIAHRDAAEP
jgi:hypothetical protein